MKGDAQPCRQNAAAASPVPRRDDFAVRWSHSLCTFPDIQRRATWPLFAGDVCTRRSPGSPTRSEPRGPINFDVDRRDAPAANYASGEQHHPWRCGGPILAFDPRSTSSWRWAARSGFLTHPDHGNATPFAKPFRACLDCKSESPARGKRGSQRRLRGEPRGGRANRLVNRYLAQVRFRGISPQRIWFRGLWRKPGQRFAVCGRNAFSEALGPIERAHMCDCYFKPLTATMLNFAYFSPIFSAA